MPTFSPDDSFDNDNDAPQGASSSVLFAPDGAPWCRFKKGFLYCINEHCMNPNHRDFTRRSSTGLPKRGPVQREVKDGTDEDRQE